MKHKEALRTVRFQLQETQQVDAYLKKNPIFESFSSLARVAILSFIQQRNVFHLNPINPEVSQNKPSFLWDYDLTEMQANEILSSFGLSDAKKWLMERILIQARFEEVCRYLDFEIIQKYLPQLRIPSKIKDRWSYALARWSTHG